MNSHHIIIVDDEIGLGQSCQELLTAHGFTVSHYSGAADALSEVFKTEFDLLVTDIGLAGKSGYDLAAEINLQRRNESKSPVPVIFVSGGLMPTLNPEGLNCYFLEKPFRFNSLLEQIRTIFESHHPDKEAG